MTEGLIIDGVPSLDEIEAELVLRDLVRFVPRMTPRYMEPRHLTPLLRRFELAADGIPQRVCCSAPPRCAKSESVFHVPAFVLRRFPHKTLSYSTYGDRLSRKGSRKSRAICRAAGLDVSEGTVNEWRTPEGGGLLAGGVGGPLTGFGVDIAIVDDPTKNRLEAESSTYRDRLMDWFHDVLMSRIEPGGSIFIFATRWHPDDLIGQLTSSEGFEYLNLPALGRDVGGVRVPDIENGESLWPERWPTAEMRKRLEEVGEYSAASLYQGQPRARGERVFGDPHAYEARPIIYQAGAGIDSAYSDKKTSDFSAVVKMLRHGDMYFVTHAARVREPMPQFKARLHVMHEAEPTMRWRWYVATSELGAAQLLRGAEGVPVVGEVAKADKFIRALRYAAAWNAGKVLVPKDAPWLEAFLAEHASFTGVNDKRDDLIDAAVAAFDVLSVAPSNGDATAPPPEGHNSMLGM